VQWGTKEELKRAGPGQTREVREEEPQCRPGAQAPKQEEERACSRLVQGWMAMAEERECTQEVLGGSPVPGEGARCTSRCAQEEALGRKPKEGERECTQAVPGGSQQEEQAVPGGSQREEQTAWACGSCWLP
jgi:hypothetical protein